MAETVGSLVDKLSIIELKIFHMQRQITRVNVTNEHKERCEQKVRVMLEQRDDLQNELSELIAGLQDGSRTMKVYRQFKMYNDPVYR